MPMPTVEIIEFVPTGGTPALRMDIVATLPWTGLPAMRKALKAAPSTGNVFVARVLGTKHRLRRDETGQIEVPSR